MLTANPRANTALMGALTPLQAHATRFCAVLSGNLHLQALSFCG